MAKRRPSGDGIVRKRSDGRWKGRVMVGHKENSDSIFRYIYTDTQKELTAKLRQNIGAYQGAGLTELNRMTLSDWLDHVLKISSGLIYLFYRVTAVICKKFYKFGEFSCQRSPL